MKLSIARLILTVLAASPAAASIQIGPTEMPEKDYRSVRACERALAALVMAELAKPRHDGRTARIGNGELTIETYAAPVTSWQTFRCRGWFLNEVRGGVMPSLEPPRQEKP